MRRTWSLVGQTPVLDADGGHREKVSVVIGGGQRVAGAADRLGFYFGTEPGGYFTAEKVVGFLRELLQPPAGRTSIVAWDRGGNHKGPVIRESLRRNRRLRVEMLPALGPGPQPGGGGLVVAEVRPAGQLLRRTRI